MGVPTLSNVLGGSTGVLDAQLRILPCPSRRPEPPLQFIDLEKPSTKYFLRAWRALQVRLPNPRGPREQSEQEQAAVFDFFHPPQDTISDLVRPIDAAAKM